VKKNDYDEVYGMKQEVDSKDRVTHIEMICREEDESGRAMVMTDKERRTNGAEWRSTYYANNQIE